MTCMTVTGLASGMLLRMCCSVRDRDSWDLSSAHSSATTQLSIYGAPTPPSPECDPTGKLRVLDWNSDATTAMALRQPNEVLELLLVIIKRIMKIQTSTNHKIRRLWMYMCLMDKSILIWVWEQEIIKRVPKSEKTVEHWARCLSHSSRSAFCFFMTLES